MREFKSFYKTVGGNEGSKCRYPTRLDLYGCGCAHDCSYCYAKSLLSFRGLWNPQDPAGADMDKVRKRIAKIPPGGVVRLGGMTDCFQDAERTHRLTLQTIRALAERRVFFLIVTKSDMVADDLYMDAMPKDLAHIQISITATDDKRAQGYEKAPSISRRIEAVEKLTAAGFDTALRLSPFIPEYIDFDRLAAVRCDKLLVEFLRVNHWIKRWFDIDYTPYTLKSGGYLHLPLERKIDLLHKIHGFREVSVCEDVTAHYEFWKKHVNPNPEDCCNLRATKKGESYGNLKAV